MPAAVIGGNIVYPNLSQIARLFRFRINDTFNNGATAGTSGAQGLIMNNDNPDLLTCMDAGIRDVYTDLRNVGDAALLLDNYCLIGLPPLAQPDPSVQVCISYAGFFDGYQWHSEWTLPVSATRIERLWERWSNLNGINALNFTPMTVAPFGLPPCVQTQWFGQWEMRQNAVWMPGSLVQEDIRIRCRISFPDFQQFNPTSIDFDTAYVPILGCTNAVVAKMCVQYAMRFAPEQYPMATAEDEKQTFKLRQEVVRQQQNTEYQRAQYGDAATGNYGWLQQL